MKGTLPRIVGGDRRINSSVGRDTDNMFGSVGRDTQYKGSVGRDTDNVFGSVGRDTNNLNRVQGKRWIRSGNDKRELLSNPTTTHWMK